MDSYNDKYRYVWVPISLSIPLNGFWGEVGGSRTNDKGELSIPLNGFSKPAPVLVKCIDVAFNSIEWIRLGGGLPSRGEARLSIPLNGFLYIYHPSLLTSFTLLILSIPLNGFCQLSGVVHLWCMLPFNSIEWIRTTPPPLCSSYIKWLSIPLNGFLNPFMKL